MSTAPPLRVVLAKVGLDGHDRGVKVVARALRDAGMHVIYAGLWQTPEAVVRAVIDEDANWLGLSLLSGAHMTLVPRVLEMMRQARLEDVGLLVGGIIPEADVPKLIQLGVARGFGPGPVIRACAWFLRGAERSVAVLACDPQSPLTGGALLGDRIRMPNRPADEAVFIRSVATPGGRSGVAPNVERMIDLFGHFGFDTVIVETVGAGQGDT